MPCLLAGRSTAELYALLNIIPKSLKFTLKLPTMIRFMIKAVIEFVMGILETAVFIASIFLVFYLFIVQPNQVKGVSMENTFHSGEYIFTSKISYKFAPIKRGDIVIFKSPKNNEVELIKRVIALPGDTVMIQNETVYVNNEPIVEKYIKNPTQLIPGGAVEEGVPIEITDGFLFVMGDNRGGSSDSREFGPVPESLLVGQVIFRYFPFSEMGVIKNPLSYLPQATSLSTT